jgi:hypothetical protein
MRILVGVIAAVILAACGGGDSSSGGGGDAAAGVAATTAQDSNDAGSNPPAASQAQPSSQSSGSAGSLAGTYTGTADVTVTIDTLNLVYELDIEVVVSPNGQVSVDVEGKTDRTTLDGNDYEGSVVFEETKDGIVCSGRIHYMGSVNGSITSGSTSGDGVCNQGGQLADVTLNGSYVASRQ